MRRDLGLWTVVRENAYDDPATAAAAAVLVRGGVPSYVAALVAVTVAHRLECWAIRDGDQGLTGHLAADRLAGIAWPEAPRGPRSMGRGEKLGNLLRAALAATPADGSQALLVLGCGGTCAGLREFKVAGITSRTCPHEGFHSWTIRPPKIVQDRLSARDKAAAKAQGGQGVPSVQAAAPAQEAPPEIRTNVGRPPDEVRRYPIPSQPLSQEREEKGSGGQPAAAAPPLPPSMPAAPAWRRGGPARSSGDVVAAIMGALPRPPAAGAQAPGGEGSARSSRAPGAGAGEVGRDEKGAAARALLGAEPNVREQVKSGRNLTLRDGAYYLFRIGTVSAARRGELERELGPAPAPGALLLRADPDRMELLTRVVSGKWASLTNPDAYVRSTLASAWTEYLTRLEGAAESARHQAALEASAPAGPRAMSGSA